MLRFILFSRAEASDMNDFTVPIIILNQLGRDRYHSTWASMQCQGLNHAICMQDMHLTQCSFSPNAQHLEKTPGYFLIPCWEQILTYWVDWDLACIASHQSQLFLYHWLSLAILQSETWKGNIRSILGNWDVLSHQCNWDRCHAHSSKMLFHVYKYLSHILECCNISLFPYSWGYFALEIKKGQEWNDPK